MTPASSWPKAAPAEAGFSPDIAERLDADLRSGQLDGLHAVLVLRDGRLVVERYVTGPDAAWSWPLGVVEHGPGTLHDIRSVTKSVVALLYGIALDRGLVPPPETALLDAIPDYPDLAADPRRRRLTIDHALTMTLGLEWDESAPCTSAANSEIAMDMAPDRVRFVLERPIVEEPGRRWVYSGGASVLLGRVLVLGTGRSLPDFAREALFEPLGIGESEWHAARSGLHSAASGLRLTARDLARIGELVRRGGRHGERQVISRAALDRLFEPSVPTDYGAGYGRHWYLMERATPIRPDKAFAYVGAFGNGGQRLWVMPEAGLTVVILAGNYNHPDQWMAPVRVWTEIVLPSLRAK